MVVGVGASDWAAGYVRDDVAERDAVAAAGELDDDGDCVVLRLEMSPDDHVGHAVPLPDGVMLDVVVGADVAVVVGVTGGGKFSGSAWIHVGKSSGPPAPAPTLNPPRARRESEEHDELPGVPAKRESLPASTKRIAAPTVAPVALFPIVRASDRMLLPLSRRWS